MKNIDCVDIISLAGVSSLTLNTGEPVPPLSSFLLKSFRTDNAMLNKLDDLRQNGSNLLSNFLLFAAVCKLGPFSHRSFEWLMDDCAAMASSEKYNEDSRCSSIFL